MPSHHGLRLDLISDSSKLILSCAAIISILQRAVLSVLEPDAEQLFHEDSFGYRPHRGVHTAMQWVNERVKCGQDWLVDADIQSFFDSIPHHQLRQVLYGFIRDKPMRRLIDIWLKQGTHFKSLLGTRQGISQGGGFITVNV